MCFDRETRPFSFQAFAEDKQREIEADAPREIDVTIPGWGAWVGKGVHKPSQQHRAQGQRKFVKHVDGIPVEARRDGHLSHVILNERRDRKSVKYLVRDLPFPYTSASQHEHRLRQPLGPEWTTLTTQRAATMPSVLTRPGVLIEPISKSGV